MKRPAANILCGILDSLLPPIVRDHRYLMYPLFRYWLKGSDDISILEAIRRHRKRRLGTDRTDRCFGRHSLCRLP